MSRRKSDTEPKAFNAKKMLEAMASEQKDGLQKLFKDVLEQAKLAETERKQVMEILGRLIEESKIERERISLDMVMKELSIHFKEAFVQMLGGYKVDPKQIECLVGRELIAIKRIADVIFGIQDDQGNKYLLSVEFEARYKSNENMDRRIAEYQHLSSMDSELGGKRIKCNVFYLQDSPDTKPPVEKRKNTYSPPGNPDLKIEIVYQIFHLNQFDIPMILEQNSSFLIPLMKYMPKATIEEREKYKAQLTKMTKKWNKEQHRSVQNILDYIFKNPHTNSEGITIIEMLKGADLNLWDDGKAEGQREGEARGLEKGRAESLRENMQRLFIKGKITYEDLVEELGKEEAEAIRDIRDKTGEALEEE